MNSSRKTAIITGILLIVATVAGVLGSSIMGPILDAPDYLRQVAASGNRMIAGALVSYLGYAACAGIAISLYPVLKKHNPWLALGAVAFRLVEAVFYIVGALCLLSLLPLGRDFVDAGAPGASYFQVVGHLLLTAHDLAGFVFAVLAFCIGGGLYYYVFLRTRLIPRWLSAAGLVSLLLLLSAVLITLFNGEPYSVSGDLVFLAAPIFLQEMIMAVWLIAKGFNAAALASLPADRATNEVLSAA